MCLMARVFSLPAVGSRAAQPSREDLAAQIKEVEQLIAEQTGASTHGEAH